jgi:hypothetical protein
MKRLAPYLAFVLGIVITVLLLRPFSAAQPKGIRLTRGDAIPIADSGARQIGIPVDQAWKVLSWQDSPRLRKELEPRWGGKRSWRRRTPRPPRIKNFEFRISNEELRIRD